MELFDSSAKTTSDASAPPLSVADTPEIANTTSTANAVISNPNLAERIAFYHASMFSPALSTWCTAIDAGHFTRTHVSPSSPIPTTVYCHGQRAP